MDIEAKKPGHPLEKGQMWKLEHGYLHVVDVGKRFAHYKILRQPNQRAVTTRLIGIGELVAYLAHNEAEVTQ
jgi:hypothetical protein